MTQSPLISIILPAYNVSRYIERCVASLQAQTYEEFEMVFVDDCGTDGSIEIVEGYAENDSRIKILDSTLKCNSLN